VKESVHINSLWIGESLSPLEQLTIKSFLSQGHQFTLWTYEQVDNIPTGTDVRSADEIIPESMVFRYNNPSYLGHGQYSYAGFSDLFRYKLLYEKGGCWTDMDITCLRPLIINEPFLFRHHHKSGAIGNLMYCLEGSEIMLWCYEQSVKRIHAENRDWMLPVNILNEGIKKFVLSSYVRKISNNDSFPVVAGLLQNKTPDPEWQIIHWMNEEFRRVGIPKDRFLKDSILDKLLSFYSIPHQQFRGWETVLYKIKLSLPYYAGINIRNWKHWVSG
jgi:hypothetical protein